MVTVLAHIHKQTAVLHALFTVAATQVEKQRAGENCVFPRVFEQRQGANCFVAAALGAVYGLTVGLDGRDASHFQFGAIVLLSLLVNAN